MNLDTYLTFNGNCREAFEFYRSSFGGEFAFIQTFGDAPMDIGVPDTKRDLMMHISLPIGSSKLMGSDASSVFGSPTVVGNNFSITIHADSREEADDLFAKLAEGGSVNMPLQEAFWGAYFGSFKDKFDINWQINHTIPQG